jgi:hypothetical protein
MDELERKPRRRVEMIAKFSADDWKTLAHDLEHAAREIHRHGKLSKLSIMGGYSSGHIIATSEDGTIDHDSWDAALNEHLEAERTKASA